MAILAIILTSSQLLSSHDPECGNQQILCEKLHAAELCFRAELLTKSPNYGWLPHKAARNAKDLILKFCHSFRDTASPLAS